MNIEYYIIFKLEIRLKIARGGGGGGHLGI